MKRKILSVFAAIALALAPALGANAATVTIGSDGSGTTNSSSTIPFSRTVSGASNNITNTFTYAITPKPDNPAGASNQPSTTQIVFNNEQPSNGTVTKNGTIDFSGATFTTVGDYYYTVRETASSNSDLYPVSHQSFTAMLSVRNQVGAGGTPSGNLEVTLVQLLEGTDGQKAAANFASATQATYIHIDNKVTGNNADTNKCFKLKVTFNGGIALPAGSSYKINTASTCENPASMPSSGEVYVYLKGGESLTIGQDGTLNQLPIGAQYTVSSEDVDGYTVNYDSNTTPSTTSGTKTTVATDHGEFSKSNVTDVVNTRNGAPLTGIVTNIWLYVFIAVIGALGIGYAIKSAKRQA